MPTIRALTPTFGIRPPVDPVNRKLGVTTDRIQSHGLDMSKALGPRGTGLVWAAVENGASIPNAKRSVQAGPRVARPGHEPRHHRQGQPAEHAGLRHPPRQRGAGRRRKGLDRQPRQQHVLDRHDRRGRRRDRPGDPVRERRYTAKRTTPSGRSPPSSSWPRRTATSPTSAATGTKGSSRGTSACTFNRERSRAAAARHGVQRSRRLSARRRGALQGDPPAEHAERHPPAAIAARRSSSRCATASTASSTSAR